MKAVRGVSEIESVWLALRNGCTKKTAAGAKGVRPFSYTEMAKALGISRQAVYRIEKRMLMREDVRKYLSDAVPRAKHFVRHDARGTT